MICSNLLKYLTRASALAVIIPAFSFGQADSDANNPRNPGNAAVRPETDDATKRRDAQRDQLETPMTPEFMKFMNSAAARERARNGDALPAVNSSGGTTSGTITSGSTTVSGGTWSNLGPTKADVIKNGGTTLYKTDAGRPVAIVPDPTNVNVLYVAFSGGGVWKSTNATATQPTWTPMTESLGSLSCGALALDPKNTQNVYLGLGDSFDGTGIGFVRSFDGGATWQPVQYLGNATKITDIRVAQDNSAVVMVTTNAGLFRSTDSGATFALVSLATGNTSAPTCWSIAFGGGANYAISLEANAAATSGTTDGQVFYTTDDGATWTRATGMTKSTGVGRITVGSSPANRLVMFAEAAIPNSSSSSDLADFFRSADGGHTWTAMGATSSGVAYTNRNTESSNPKTILNGQGWYNQLVIPSVSDTNTVFFGGSLLLAKATSATASKPAYTQMTNWLAQFSLPYVHADFHAGAYDAAGNFFVGTDGGIFMSADNGTTWTDKFNIGIASHLIYSVGSSDSAPDAVIGGFQDNGTRVRASNTSTFNQYIGGDGFGSHIHAVTGTTMLGSLYYTRIYKSTDGGQTFASASSGITESNNSSSAPFETKIIPWLGDATGNTMFTPVNLKVYKSTNYAASWTALGVTGLPTSGNIRGFGVAQSNGNVMGTVWNGGRVFLTTSGGASWSLATSPTNNGLSMSYVSFDPANANTVYVASVAPDATKPHLWKSADFGATWQVLDVDGSGFPSGVPVNTIKSDNGKLYAGTHLGVYQSADGGATWTRFGAGMPLVNVRDVYISPSHTKVRAATFGRGFWETPTP
ncbi:MAG: hypothetical protein ABR526_04555 [Chthoniobacterales bacterium]